MMSTPHLNGADVAVNKEQKYIQLVTFCLDQYHFAVPVEQVWRVEALADFSITRVPGTVAFLEGLINLRGRVIPTIDLKKRLGLSPLVSAEVQASAEAVPVHPSKARLLIVEMDIADQREEKVAMIVDTVKDIRWFSAANLRTPPLMVADIGRQYLLGVLEEDGQLWIVLELRQVLNTEERDKLRSEAEKSPEVVNEQIAPQTTDQLPTDHS